MIFSHYTALMWAFHTWRLAAQLDVRVGLNSTLLLTPPLLAYNPSPFMTPIFCPPGRHAPNSIWLDWSGQNIRLWAGSLPRRTQLSWLELAAPCPFVICYCTPTLALNEMFRDLVKARDKAHLANYLWFWKSLKVFMCFALAGCCRVCVFVLLAGIKPN